MTQHKLIVILGATGNQGGSTVTTFLQNSEWRVRALTRTPHSSKAQALAARGAEVMYADMDSPASLTAAFEHAHAIFAVSDFWGLYSDPANQGKAAKDEPLNVWAGKHETEQLKRVIDAAAKVPTLERFVLSSLSYATKWSGGKYTHVYHFDSKARAEMYGRETYPELWAKTSIFQAGLFLGNYITKSAIQPQMSSNGVIQFISQLNPNVKLPYIAAEEDTGPFVQALVQDSPGKNLIAYREWCTLREVSAALAQVTGFAVECIVLPKGQPNPDLPPELREEMDECLAYFDEFGYEGRDDPTVVHPKDLNSPPQLESVVDWVRKQDWTQVFGEQRK
ncbi:hypothetical protein ACMFMG_003531 [Clarireedia jacksonii]